MVNSPLLLFLQSNPPRTPIPVAGKKDALVNKAIPPLPFSSALFHLRPSSAGSSLLLENSNEFI
jgi:hypothetical protein